MNSHLTHAPDRSTASGNLVHLTTGQAVPLGRFGGELAVVAGSVWLTRDGDPADHVIERGERIRVSAADQAVIEALHPAATATVRWQPHRQRFSALRFSAVLWAAPLRALAALARRAATGFEALARSAAASAWRAQGCIAGGDSIASSGALK